MKNIKTIYTIIPVGLVCAAAGIFVGRHTLPQTRLPDACEAAAATDVCCPADEIKADACHEDDACAHGAANPDALAQTACEHDVAMADCDECRYEAGLVKLAPSITDALLETGVAGRQERVTALRLNGQIQLDPTRTVDVVGTGAGRVEQIFKRLGDRVARGDVLAVIHSPELGRAKAEFLEAEAELELAETVFARERDLLEKNITSRADYLEADSRLKAAQAGLAAADKRLRLFGLDDAQMAAVKDEKQNGDFAALKLTAPQSGTVIAQNLSAGTIAAEDAVLFTISDLSNLWVWCDVYEGQLAALHEALHAGRAPQAVVKVGAFGETAFSGTADFVDNMMDERTRTVKVRIRVDNSEGKLRPGMFARAQVLLQQSGSVLTVPESAVMRDGESAFVFEHWKDDLWVRRDITPGQCYGGTIEVLAGLDEGDTIVTGGAFMLKSDILREKMGAGCAD